MPGAPLQDIVNLVVRFRDDRDWSQFHTPRNLAAAIAIEASELQETMLWRTDAEVESMLTSHASRKALADEIADVMIYALLLAHGTGIEVESAIREKLAANALKYPIDKARGSAKKYTELREDT